MQLRKIVIHELSKEHKKVGATLDLSNRCLSALEERPRNLNLKLYESFLIRNNKVDYAAFQEEESFPQRLSQYINSGRTEEDFIGFTSDAITRLFEQIRVIPLARGGYLVFTECEVGQKEYLSIFLVRDTKGEIFKKNGEILDIAEVIYADTGKLAMACRINIGNDLDGQGKPLLIINKRSKEVSEYFARWLGASDKESSEQYTEQLYRIISQIPPPVDPQSPTGDRLTIDETRKRVFEVVKTQLEGMVDLNVISNQVYGDQDLIPNYVHEQEIEIPTEFKTYERTMKKFVQIRANTGGFLLQFSRGDARNITFSDDNRSVIIRSPDLAAELQQQIQNLNN